MSEYEVLHIERDNYGEPIFYLIRYYNCGLECRGIDMKLGKYEFESFIEGKIEI